MEDTNSLSALLARLVEEGDVIKSSRDFKGRVSLITATVPGQSKKPDNEDKGRLMTPAEVGAIFRVDPKTPVRWANAGWLGYILTPGGQHRFYESDVNKLLQEGYKHASNDAGGELGVAAG